MKYSKLNLGQIEAIVNKLGGEEGVDRFLRGELVILEPVINDDRVFRLVVDYSQSLEQMVAACHFNWINSGITAKQFPIVEEGLVEFEARYFHFDRHISSENAVKEIGSADTKNPWMPAKIEYMLAHGKTFPDEQRKFPIVGLGSVAEVDGVRFVSCLDRDGSLRGLRLRWWGGVWNPDYRFLAVRKVSGTCS